MEKITSTLRLRMSAKDAHYGGNLVDGAHMVHLFGDVATKDIDKAVAVHKAVEYLGADMADTIAMGDAKVDIPMFEACASSVCMGSGGEEAKAAADYVTTDVAKDGLWNAFSHLGLV